MKEIKNIVTINVDFSNFVQRSNAPKRTILIDQPLWRVLKAYRENEPYRVFTLPIYTCDVEDVPDFSTLIDTIDDEGLVHAVKPLYLGNVDNLSEAILEIDNAYFGEVPLEGFSLVWKFND